MSFTALKNSIKDKLETIDDIGQVEDYPTQDFQSYPAAIVKTNGNDSDYETTTQNIEVYDFTVFLLYPHKNNVADVRKVREIMETLCDTVRDAFDSDEFLNGVVLPTGRQMVGIRPTVSTIVEAEADNGKYVAVEIDLAIRINKDI